jgi:hypothetical protein
MMKIVMNQLIKFGKVKRGVLGVNIQTLAPESRRAWTGRHSAGRARVAGRRRLGGRQGRVQAGDVITGRERPAREGRRQPAQSPSACSASVKRSTCALVRDGKPRRVTAIDRRARRGGRSKRQTSHPGLAGAESRTARTACRSAAVADGSPAAQRGLRTNDVILAGRPHARGQGRGLPKRRPRARTPSCCRSGAATRRCHPDPLTTGSVPMPGSRRDAIATARLSVCVLGGTGFIGSEVVSRLSAAPARRRRLTRYPTRHRELLVCHRCASWPPTCTTRRSSVAPSRAQTSSINLVGILNERGLGRGRGRQFEQVHTELTRKCVRACRVVRVRRYLHMSAAKADAQRGPSHYLRTKGWPKLHRESCTDGRPSS